MEIEIELLRSNDKVNLRHSSANGTTQMRL